MQPMGCRTETRCEQVPRRYQDCGYENVRRTRPVTRYRNVIRYRPERRYRTVTRYREEQRCCVTKYRDVFDHQANMNVEIEFPQEAQLIGQEQEQFKIQMLAENEVRFTILNSILGYAVESQQTQGATTKILLRMIPKYSSDELSAKTIANLALKIQGKTAVLSFADSGLRTRVNTTYSFIIIDKGTNTVVEQGQFGSSGLAEVSQALSGNYSLLSDYQIRLGVLRAGIVLNQNVEFNVDAVWNKIPLDLSLYNSTGNIQNMKIDDNGKKAALMFNDVSPDHELVKTVYQIRVSVKGGMFGQTWETMLEKNVRRADLQKRPGGGVYLALRDLGAGSSDLELKANKGANLDVRIQVVRQSEHLNRGQSFSFVKEQILPVK